MRRSYFGLLALAGDKPDPMDPDAMTSTPNQNPPQPVDLETRYLRALMERDARIYAERTAARDWIVSNAQIKRPGQANVPDSQKVQP